MKGHHSSDNPSHDKKILIVDDSLTVVKSLAKILRRAEMHPIECTQGSQAMKLVEAEKPDLVLLDLVMPDVDGLTILKTVRATPTMRSLPIVVITANKDEDLLVEALEAGADDYVNKPFKELVLLARIRTHLRSWQLLLDLEKAHLDLLDARDHEVETERWRTAVEMAGAAAHKLNQPLTSIVCYADMMLKKMSQDDDDYRAVKSIAEESERMAELLRKMAELTKIRSSKYVGDTTIIDLDISFEKTDPAIPVRDKTKKKK